MTERRRRETQGTEEPQARRRPALRRGGGGDGPQDPRAIPHLVNLRIARASVRRAVLFDRVTQREVARLLRFVEERLLPNVLERARRIGERLETQRAARLGPLGRQELVRQALGEMVTSIRESAGALREQLTSALLPVARSEAAWQNGTLRRELPEILAIKVNEVGLQELRSIVVSQPMQGRHLREWADSVGADTAARVRQQIQLGMAQGQSASEIVHRIRGTSANGFRDGVFQATRNQVEMVVRTTMTHVASHARTAVAKQNRDIVQGIRWLATLDVRTCPICMSLEEGSPYPVDSGPRPPAHPMCRCTPVLEIKQAEKIAGVDFSELPPAQRASMRGPVPASMTLGEWLRGESIATQNEVLGVRRAELFRRGRIPVERFADLRSQRLLTLRELERLERRLLARGA